MNYIEPKVEQRSFTCPYCNTLSLQLWESIDLYNWNGAYSKQVVMQGSTPIRIRISTCQSCQKAHIWVDGQMVIPKVASVPMPLYEMPDKVKEIYNEARDVFPTSAKAAAALLRLALQYLCVELGGEGKNINSDIGKLVKEKGLPVQIQQALDVVRVAGNNAVHPGVLDLNDTKTSAVKLFEMINFIVDNQIIQPKKIEEFYNSLPETALDGIEKRDK